MSESWASSCSTSWGRETSCNRNGQKYFTHPMLKWNEWCLSPQFCTKATLGRGQPGLMKWIVVWIMPQVQHKSLNLLTCSPVHHHCAAAAPTRIRTMRIYCNFSIERAITLQWLINLHPFRISLCLYRSRGWRSLKKVKMLRSEWHSITYKHWHIKRLLVRIDFQYCSLCKFGQIILLYWNCRYINNFQLS